MLCTVSYGAWGQKVVSRCKHLELISDESLFTFITSFLHKDDVIWMFSKNQNKYPKIAQNYQNNLKCRDKNEKYCP